MDDGTRGALVKEAAEAAAAEPVEPVEPVEVVDEAEGADGAWTPAPTSAAFEELRRRFAFSGVVRALTRFLALGLLGVAAMGAGLIWDAAAHARDPGLAHEEGSLINVTSPAHVLLLAGGVVAFVGLTGALVRALSLSGSRRLSSPRTGVALVAAMLVAVAGTVGAVQWAGTAEPAVATGPLAPAPGDAHGVGIVDSHAGGPCRPTQTQKAAAAKLYNDTEAGVARYRNLAVAMAEGYAGPVAFTSTEHFINVANTTDGQTLDTAKPEALMYTPTARGPVLVGAMYLMNVPGEFGPEPGGCLTPWHVHANLCYNGLAQIVAFMTPEQPECPAGTAHLIPPPALHVWFVDVPGGRFAPDVDADYLAKKVGP